MRPTQSLPRYRFEVRGLKCLLRRAQTFQALSRCELLGPGAHVRCKHGAGCKELEKFSAISLHGETPIPLEQSAEVVTQSGAMGSMNVLRFLSQMAKVVGRFRKEALRICNSPPTATTTEKQPKQTVSRAEAPIGTSEDAELVGKSLEQEVSTCRPIRSDGSTRPDDGWHRL